MCSIHDLHVPEEMFATFAADPTGVLDKIARIANDPQSPLHESVNRFLATIPRAAVAETCADTVFRGFYGSVQNPDRLARIWFAERLLIDHIYERRLERIREAGGNLRPAPYSTAALSDVLVDSEGLVRLSILVLMDLGSSETSLPLPCSPRRVLRIPLTGFFEPYTLNA
jgi:hypothetical protein